jgi:hypothetical protein
MNEPAAEFLTYLVSNLKSKKTIVTSNDNIFIGEKANIQMLSDSDFPRLEIVIKKLNGGGYVDQGNIDEGFRVTIVGFIKRDSDDTTDQDMYDIINFARETKKIVYQANSDRGAGTTVCEGFEQISGFSEIFVGYEMAPRTSAFVFEFEAEILLRDTFTNN